MKLLAILSLAILSCHAHPGEENLYPYENREMGGLFNGDMMLTEEQHKVVTAGGDIAQWRKYRPSSAMRNVSVLWYPNRVVPYTIVPELEKIAAATMGIMKGFREWEENSCLKFARRTNEVDYVEMIGDGGGCWSYVGVQGGKQQMSLTDGCWGTATVVHEFGHAIGFGHEQNRPDRDSYIEVVSKNVPKSKLHNFEKYSNAQVDSLGSPYDYLSFMQYSERAFGINGTVTMVPKKAGVWQLGNEVGFTQRDRFQAMALYRCKGKTTRPRRISKPIVLPGDDDCTFENGMCHFTQSKTDDSDWLRRIGASPSWGTGPNYDHTTKRMGTFLYLEASSPAKKGQTARLHTKTFTQANPQETHCMSFFYHIFAYNATMMGEFRVYVNEGENLREIFSQVGSSGINDWQEARIDISASIPQYQIVFEAIRGSGYQGDIAIDDVSFTNKECKATKPTPPKKITPHEQCHDTKDRESRYCAQWKGAGFCKAYKNYMRRFCKKTCAFC